MQINPIITEQTTAATDFILGVLAFLLLFFLQRKRTADVMKKRYWSWMFGFLGFASILGAVAHGFVLSELLYKIIWNVLYLALGVTVAFFAIGASHEMWGERISKKAAPFVLTTALLFYGVTMILPDSFLIFIAYEAVALLGALGIYLYISFTRRDKACYWMVGGICLSILASIIQAMGNVHVTLLWEFDHNSIFHLIQMGGLFLIYFSLKLALQRP